MDFNKRKIKLGDLLVETGAITKEQLMQALEKQKKNNMRLGETLVDEGFITEDDIAHALSNQLNIDIVDLQNIVIDKSVLNLVPLNILKKYSLTGVIHCFSGSKETAMEYVKLGYKLGIGGVCTYKNAKIIDVVREIGLENIVLETDSPYLSPVPFRGKQNIPGNVNYVVDFISESLEISKENVALITTYNAFSVFDKIKPL